METLCLIPILLIGNWDVKYPDSNNVYCGVSNYGPILLNCEWPKNSNHYYIFGAGIWFGALLPDTCVSMGYDPNSATDELVPGLCRQGTTAYYNPIVRVYIYPEDWPPPRDTFPMAPDTVLTTEDSWACFNDNDPAFHDSNDTHPIGIEVYQSSYTDTFCPNAIFFRYTVKNCTTYTITKAYLGICIDYDIGEDSDDMYGLYEKKWFPDNQKPDSFYIDVLPFGCDYDWQEPGWNKVGAVGIYILETPNNTGPTACLAFDLGCDPSSDYQRYLMMKGIDYQTGDSIGFMPGPVGPGDMRFLLSSGPFDLNPGDTVHFGFVTVLAYDTLTIAWAVNQARKFYYQQVGVEQESSPKLSNIPVVTIVNGSVYIGRNDWLTILDPLGRIIQKIKSPPEEIKLDNLSSGIYFLMLEKGSKLSRKKIVLLR